MLVAAAACAPLSHVQKLREGQVSAQLVLSQEEELLPELDFGASPTHRDTLVVKDPEGNDVLSRPRDSPLPQRGRTPRPD